MGSQRSLISSLCLSFLLLLLSLLAGQRVAEGSSHHHGHRHRQHFRFSDRHAIGFQPTKLFVFGDSYSDTGNTRKSDNSWKDPYGITFPGKPSGRFSNGRVLTDFLAESFGLEAPVPYESRGLGQQYLKYGMNFAYGGTGVFDTLISYPNMTTQIGHFEQLIKENTFSSADLNSSLTLVTVSGNDYSAFLARKGTIFQLEEFIKTVITQLSSNLRRLYDLGVRKAAVAGLEPLGCLPSFTFLSSFEDCIELANMPARFHNQLLHQAVADLNNQTASSTFLVLDLYGSFMSAINGTGVTKFEKPLKPCCAGASIGLNCASVDKDGKKMYTVCENPESSFFWDSTHPTQAGWRAVYSSLSV